MKVAYSYSAQDDLLEIHKWIHKGNPARAESFIDELDQICAAIGENPLAYPVAFDSFGYIIRKRVWRDYLIFYRVEPDVIVIMRAGHAAQNWQADQFD